MTSQTKPLLISARIAPIDRIGNLVTLAHVNFAATENDKNAKNIDLDLNGNPKNFFAGYEDGEYVIRTNLPEISTIFARKSGETMFIGSSYSEICDTGNKSQLVPVDEDNNAYISTTAACNIDNANYRARTQLGM